MYTLDELIEKGNHGDVKAEREKFHDIWRVFGVDQLKLDLIESNGNYLFDKEDADFFNKLLYDYHSQLWKKYFRLGKFQIGSVKIEDKKVNLFEELEYVVNGLISYYNKNVEDEEKRRVFREVLYIHTHYRKLKLENNLSDMMKGLPELDKNTTSNGSSCNNGEQYEDWLEELKRSMTDVYNEACVKWESLVMTEMEGFDSYIAANCMESPGNGDKVKRAVDEFFRLAEEIDPECGQKIKDFWYGQDKIEDTYTNLKDGTEKRKWNDRCGEVIGQVLKRIDPIALDILKGKFN